MNNNYGNFSLRLISDYVRNIVLFILVLWLVLQFPSNLLRLSGSVFFTNVSFYILYIVAFLAIIIFVLEKGVLVSGRNFFIFYIGFLFYSLCIGFFNNNFNFVYGIKYYLLPFVVIVLVSKVDVVYDLFYLRSTLWKVVILFHVIGLVVYYFFLKGTIYPGIGVQSIAYAFLYFFTTKNLFFSIVSMVCILLESKRSILLSVILTLIFMQFFRRSKAESFLFVIICLSLILVLLKVFGAVEGIPMIDRINFLNPFSSKFDVFIGSSGRMGELVSFFSNKDFLTIFFGSGLGFTYVWDVGYESLQTGEVKGYFHATYVNYIATAGFIGLLFSLYLFRSVVVVNDNWLNSKVIRAFCLFSLIQASFGFNLASDIISWVFIFFPITYRAYLRSSLIYK